MPCHTKSNSYNSYNVYNCNNSHSYNKKQKSRAKETITKLIRKSGQGESKHEQDIVLLTPTEQSGRSQGMAEQSRRYAALKERKKNQQQERKQNKKQQTAICKNNNDHDFGVTKKFEGSQRQSQQRNYLLCLMFCGCMRGVCVCACVRGRLTGIEIDTLTNALGL